MTLLSSIRAFVREFAEPRISDFILRHNIRLSFPIVLQDDFGIRTILYPWSSCGILQSKRREFFKADFELIRQLIKPTDIVFDVGANIGLYTVLMSRLVSDAGHVYAFEPAPETVRLLDETLALNGCKNVMRVQAAVSDSTSQREFFTFEPKFSEFNSLAYHSMQVKSARVNPGSSVLVPGETLDTFCEQKAIAHINLLKVDVEGFEAAVFAGASSLLRNHRIDYILFEISHEPLSTSGYTARDVFASLENYGYEAHEFDSRGIVNPKSVSDSQEYYRVYLALAPGVPLPSGSLISPTQSK